VSINNAGQAVGGSAFGGEGIATEWSGGSIIRLEGPSQTIATGINNSGLVVGYSFGIGPFFATATEWIGGSPVYLQNLPGATESLANGINNAGQVVGASFIGGVVYATEWSGGSVINLGGLPGQTYNLANSINDAGLVQVVGYSAGAVHGYAAEWRGGSVTALGTGIANSINDAGQVVGQGVAGATEWSGGNVINLGALPGSIGSEALGINDAGVVVGDTSVVPTHSVFGTEYATEWSGAIGGSITNLGVLPGDTFSVARGINDHGLVVGDSGFPSISVPEPATWAMMLAGFAGLALAGYRRAKAGHSRALV
jgi:probable HAF family extracellular repeat protein